MGVEVGPVQPRDVADDLLGREALAGHHHVVVPERLRQDGPEPPIHILPVQYEALTGDHRVYLNHTYRIIPETEAGASRDGRSSGLRSSYALVGIGGHRQVPERLPQRQRPLRMLLGLGQAAGGEAPWLAVGVDERLEESAEEVKNYVQKGGESC